MAVDIDARREGEAGVSHRSSPSLLEWPMTLWPAKAATIALPMPRLVPVTRMLRGVMARR